MGGAVILTLDLKTVLLWSSVRHFRPVELGGSDPLSCPCCGLLSIELDAMLDFDRARRRAGVPFAIAPGGACRCADYQRQLVAGGKTDVEPTGSAHVPQAHCGTYALDILTHGDTERAGHVLAALAEIPFRRLGVYSTFIHADRRPDLPSPRLWHGG